MIDQFFVTVALLALFIHLVMLMLNGKKLSPGPLRLPILGSAIQLYRANALLHYSAVVVSSYEAIKDLFKLHDTNSSRFDFPYVNDRNYGKNLGIIFGHGRNWVEVRAFTKKVLKEFGYGKVKQMDQSLADSARQLVDDIYTDLLDSSDGSFAVETKKCAVHVLNVVWNLVGGYKFDPNEQLLKRNMKYVDKAVLIYGNENPYNVFPFLKTWFPNQFRYPEHLKIHEEIHGFSKFLIADAKEKRSQRLDVEPTSFIEVFLDKIDECHEDPNTLFTQEQLEIILKDLLLGSLETAGTLLNWSILFMVLNPDIQDKLRQVILGKMADHGGVLPAMELKRLLYVKATILEIFRKGNVVPVPAPRCATKDVKIRDYIIPKCTILFYSLHAIYNERNYWKDPETFRPERYLNENGEIDQLRSEKILNTVFGVGPRVCFGENIGLDSMFMFFAALITNFKFDAIPGLEPSEDNPHSGICIGPREYSVKITKLSIAPKL